jgi:hypothetical protein
MLVTRVMPVTREMPVMRASQLMLEMPAASRPIPATTVRA